MSGILFYETQCSKLFNVSYFWKFVKKTSVHVQTHVLHGTSVQYNYRLTVKARPLDTEICIIRAISPFSRISSKAT